MMNGRLFLQRCMSAYRLIAIACFTAALSFTFALATAPQTPEASARSAAAAKPRAFDDPLRFTNPFLLPGDDFVFYPLGGATPNDSQGFDLGDVARTSDV